MDSNSGTARRLQLVEHERREAVMRLAMVDASLAAHRRARHWAIVRRLVIGRGGIYRRLLELNLEVERAGGEALPRRRFERQT